MRPDEALYAETREWLARARADLSACSVLIAADLAAEALFHAQQCAEKALKALLTWSQATFKKTHDLDELKQSCVSLDAGIAVQLEGVERLSHYAWRFRYPGAPYIPDTEEAEEGRRVAAGILDVVEAHLISQFGEAGTQGDRE